jgi:hypothetical protein
MADYYPIEVGDPHIHPGNCDIGNPRGNFGFGVRLGYLGQAERLRTPVHVSARRSIFDDRSANHRLAGLVGPQRTLQAGFGDSDCLRPREPTNVLTLAGRRGRYHCG